MTAAAPSYAASPRFVMYRKQYPDEEAYYRIEVLELKPEAVLLVNLPINIIMYRTEGSHQTGTVQSS